MTVEQFFKWLESQPIKDRIVYMRYRYFAGNEWEYSNEVLEVDYTEDKNYFWLDDWNEGQPEVEILGCVPIEDVKIQEEDFK